MIAGLWRNFEAACADLLWPRRCPGCDAEPVAGNASFCSHCLPLLSAIDPHSACVRCAAPLGQASLRRGCLDCLRLAPQLARIHAPYEYGGVLADALMRFKWQGRDDLAVPLGRLLAPLLRKIAAPHVGARPFDMVVPVPLHPQRLRQRGYNQAALLARAALTAAKLDQTLPLVATALYRTRIDPPAQKMDLAERFARTQGAFALSRIAKTKVAGKRILLFDDVVTTGATALACATALTASGAHVQALALLRAPPPL